MPSKTLHEFLIEVDKIITASDDEYSTVSREACIKTALNQYSQDRPNLSSTDVAGAGSRYYALTGGSPVISDWIDDFSRVRLIEYPAAVVANNEMPQLLDNSDWQQDYQAGGIKYLFLPNHSPASGETIRVLYTTPYQFSGDPEAADVPADDFLPISYLAACYCCRNIATKYSRTTDSIIRADSVNHPSRAQMFAKRAKEYCELYAQHIAGILASLDGDEAGLRPMSEWIDWDTRPRWPPGRRYLYHDND
jgi:hypothetical protein